MRLLSTLKFTMPFALAFSALVAAAPVRADDEIRVGVNGVVSDVVFYIAQSRGFFAEQKIKLQMVSFDSGPKMIAPLGTGQLDVVAGAASAGLFNAVARGVDIKIVADKGSMGPGRNYMPLLVRKDLVETGKVKSFADLKGLKVGEAGQGGSPGSTLNEALKKGGLTYADVDHIYLGYPQQVAAFSNKAIDAAITTEPSATMAVKSGVAVRFSDDTLYPNQQVAVLLYGGDFIRKHRDTAQRFMIAYLKAARVYNDAIAPGHLTGPGSEEIIKLISDNMTLKDADLLKQMIPNGVDPDGKVDMASLENDLKFYRDQGYLEHPITAETVLDRTFAEKAVSVLGPYKPK
ncbi:MAG: transporter substrate-binding protein [Hyphomicrobiales bacterium]|nr:transporter substrate-binding protein [Hyphomicrobiales bacterium]